MTLDHLSGGRLVLDVGIGGEWCREYSAFGEPAEDAVHGAMLDEGLEVLAGLWSGEPFSYQGAYYEVHDARFLPTPLRTPRIPIWVAGIWPHQRPFRRAARWDGVFPIGPGDGLSPVDAADVRAMLSLIHAERASAAPFDVVVRGRTFRQDPGAARTMLAEYVGAGVTWWLESLSHRTPLDELRTQIAKGPPRAP